MGDDEYTSDYLVDCYHCGTKIHRTAAVESEGGVYCSGGCVAAAKEEDRTVEAPEGVNDIGGPSVNLVALVLAENGPMTQEKVIEATKLTPRTARAALKSLEGRLKLLPHSQDARKKVYEYIHDTDQ